MGFGPVHVCCSVPPHLDASGLERSAPNLDGLEKNAGLAESRKCSRSEMKSQQLSKGSPFHFLTPLPFVLR